MNKLLTAKNFKKIVLENTLATAILFKTEWNGTCEIMSPVFKQLATLYEEQANFFTIDVDEDKTVAAMYGIIDLPAILFFKNGQLSGHTIGLAPKEAITAELERAINQ